MSEPTQKPAERTPEVAVAPLNTIDQQDVGAAAAAFDKWLRKISHDYMHRATLQVIAHTFPGRPTEKWLCSMRTRMVLEVFY